MRYWIFLIVIVVLGLLQVTLLERFDIFHTKPDLLLIAALSPAIFSFKRKWVIFLSIFAGIIKDVFSANPLAVNTLLFPVWVAVIMNLEKKISLENNYIRALLVFILAFLHVIVSRVVFYFGGNLISWGIFLRVTFLESLYTAGVWLLIFLNLDLGFLYSESI